MIVINWRKQIVRNSFNNPFVSCTARDMSYSDVVHFWCSPFDCYQIKESDLMTSITPIIIEGARGSGKTMILKHLSFFCQKERLNTKEMLSKVTESGYLGIYFRYSADYSTLFDSLNCSKNYREALFDGYFQLCVSLELARILQSLESDFKEFEYKKLFDEISNLLGDQINNTQDIIIWIEKNIRLQDDIIRKSQYLDIDESCFFARKNFLFDFITKIQESIITLSDVLFIIIIDEYENVGDYQKVINTHIKQMEGKNKYTFRIGVRPEGIVDYSTNVACEFLQDGRDFIKKQLVVSSDDKTARYKNFVKDVINKRLNLVPIFNSSNVSIDDLLGKKEDYDWEANYHVKGRKDHFSEILSSKNEDERQLIISTISDENPIVEAYFLMRIKRGESVSNITTVREELSQGLKTSFTKKYRLDMCDKYKVALLFWLIDKYKAKKLYYGFNTYLYLSCGSIYDFIGLCRTVFDELESDYLENFEKEKIISPSIQTIAARKYAQSQLDKVRLNHDYGPQMYHFVQNMCNLQGYYHKGDLCTSYPETNQFYVAGNFDVSGVNKEIWRSLLRWGIVIKKTSYQRASVSVNSKAQLYYVNKSYYPVFGISCRIRGGFNIELTDALWDGMIVSSVDPASIVKHNSKKEKTKNRKIIEKKPKKSEDSQQLSLFDMEDFDE